MNSAGTLPSEAEEEKGAAEDGGHSVPGSGGGPAGTEVETEPEGNSQGQQLACHKIHLEWEKKKLLGLKIQSKILIHNNWHHTQIHQWESDYGVKNLGNISGLNDPQNDSNPLTVLNELEYGRRQKNHCVSLKERATMKLHSW